jgi:hypothetical protein
MIIAIADVEGIVDMAIDIVAMMLVAMAFDVVNGDGDGPIDHSGGQHHE